MKIALVQTRCECQATLVARVDEAGRIVAGLARSFGEEQRAPATAIGAGKPQFQVSWLCPACGRNVSRSVSRESLAFSES